MQPNNKITPWDWEMPEIKECGSRSEVCVTYRSTDRNGDVAHVTLNKSYHYCDLLPLKIQNDAGHCYEICEERLFHSKCPKHFTIPECPDLRKEPCKIFKDYIYLFCENERIHGQKCERVRMDKFCPRGYPA